MFKPSSIEINAGNNSNSQVAMFAKIPEIERRKAEEVFTHLIKNAPITFGLADGESQIRFSNPNEKFDVRDPYTLLQTTSTNDRSEIITDGQIEYGTIIPASIGHMQHVKVSNYNYLYWKHILKNPVDGKESINQILYLKTYGMRIYLKYLLGMDLN